MDTICTKIPMEVEEDADSHYINSDTTDFLHYKNYMEKKKKDSAS